MALADQREQCLVPAHVGGAVVRIVVNDAQHLPHRANIQLGDEILDLIAVAVYADNGTYLGPMVRWDLGTESHRMEKDMAGQVAAISKSQAVIEFEMDGEGPAHAITMSRLDDGDYDFEDLDLKRAE